MPPRTPVKSQTFELTSKEVTQVMVTYRGQKIPKNEEIYNYECKETGAKVRFQAHPTKAWSWIIHPETNDAGKKISAKLINAFCEAGIGRGEKTFDEAIKTVTV